MTSPLPPTAAVRPRPTALADPRRSPAAQAGVRPAAQAAQAAKAAKAAEGAQVVQATQAAQPAQPAEASPRARPAAAAGGAPDAHRKPRPLAVLALQARALQHERLDAAASAVVDELARQLRCERVSLGLVHGRLGQAPKVRVLAMSHTSEVDARQPLPRLIAHAMAECVHQRSAVIHPLPQGTGLLMARAHGRLARQNGGLTVCSLPLLDLRGQGQDPHPPFAALLLERRGALDPHTLAAAQDAATFVGPVLALQRRLDQPLNGRLVDAVRPRHPGPWGLSRVQWLVAGAVLAGAVLALWPGTWRVVAPARVEGLGQQVLAAPMDGFIAQATLQPGARVQAGQVLLTLQDQDLQLEQARWAAEVSQLDKKYREAQTTDDATQIVLAHGRLAQAQAQLDLVLHQLERTRLRAPFDGVLLAGDHTQARGAPVKRGDTLLTVAPALRWRIVAEVDEQDIAPVREQQRGQVVFAAVDGPPLALQVSRVAPVASLTEGRHHFEVEAMPLPGPAASAAMALLRPGQRGVARIDIAPRLQGAVWWHRATLWARGLWWRLSA